MFWTHGKEAQHSGSAGGEAELMTLWPESTARSETARSEMVGIQPSLHGYASVT